MKKLSGACVSTAFVAIGIVGGLACADGSESSGFGSVSGRVRYEGAIPRKADVDDLGQRRVLFQVDAATGGIADAVVFLKPVDGSAVTLPKGVVSGEAIKIVQRDFRFEPHLVVVAPGQEVVFSNDDGANHNVRGESETGRNGFNVITTAEQSYSMTFVAEAGYGPVAIACDVHAWMAGWVYVIPHGLVGVTDGDGEFRIEGVPVGRWVVTVEQPDGGLVARGEIEVAEGAEVKLGVDFVRGYLAGAGVGVVEVIDRRKLSSEGNDVTLIQGQTPK